MPHLELPAELLVFLVQCTGVGSSRQPSASCSSGWQREPKLHFCCRAPQPVAPGMTVKNRSNLEMCMPIPIILKQEYAGEEEQRLKVFA